MRFRWLGTAGFEFSSGDTRLLIDPFLTRNQRANPVQDLKPSDFSGAEAVFITHGHFDHIYDVGAIAGAGARRVFASPVVCQRLYDKGLDAARLEPVEPHSKYDIGPFRVEAVPSRHVVFDIPLIARTVARCLPRLFELPGKGTFFYPAGQVFGYLAEVEGKRFYHIGSAWLDPEDMQEREMDIFFVPVQGRTDITALSAEMTAELRPHLVVPHHFDDFFPPISQFIDLEPFKQSLFDLLPHARVMVPTINHWVEV